MSQTSMHKPVNLLFVPQQIFILPDLPLTPLAEEKSVYYPIRTCGGHLAQLTAGHANSSSQPVRRVIPQGKVTITTITTTVTRTMSEIVIPEGERHFLLTVYIEPEDKKTMPGFALEMSTVAKGIDIQGHAPRQKLRPVVIKGSCRQYKGKKPVQNSCDFLYTTRWNQETRQIYRIKTDGTRKKIFLTPKATAAK